MGFSTTHLIIFLVIIVVIFGTKKLRNIGSDIGGAVKGFKDGMKDGEEPGATKAAPAKELRDTTTIDVEAKEKQRQE